MYLDRLIRSETKPFFQTTINQIKHDCPSSVLKLTVGMITQINTIQQAQVKQVGVKVDVTSYTV